MRKIITILLIAGMLLTLTACEAAVEAEQTRRPRGAEEVVELETEETEPETEEPSPETEPEPEQQTEITQPTITTQEPPHTIFDINEFLPVYEYEAEVYDYKSCEFFDLLLVAELEQLSETIRQMILNGDELDVIRTYMVDLYDSTQARVFFGYFDVFDEKETNSFTDSTSLKLGLEYDDMLEAWIEHGTVFPCPTESEWYRAAVAADGEVAMIAPYGYYTLSRSHEKDHAKYTQAIFDNDGNRLAIISMEVWIDGIIAERE